jgi:hypothetical protein
LIVVKKRGGKSDFAARKRKIKKVEKSFKNLSKKIDKHP